jgi:hypothetical protein
MNARPINVFALLGAMAFAAPAYAANPPANICIELSAWIDQIHKAGAAQGGVAGQQQGIPGGGQQAAIQKPAAPQTPQSAQAGQSGQQGGGTAVEQPSPGAQQIPGGQDTTQQTSGISGQVPDQGPGVAGPQGAAQESAKSSAENPKAAGAKPTAELQKPPEPKAPPPSPQAIDRSRQVAGSNDLEGCTSIVKDMRVAGVALPAPLIALAALKPELLQTAPQGPAPGVPPIPPSGLAPQPQPGVQPPATVQPPAEPPR